MTDEPAVIGFDLSLTASGVTLPYGRCFTIRPKLKGDRRLGEIRKAADYYIKAAVLTYAGQRQKPWLAVIETPSNIDRGGWDTTCAILFAHAIVRDVLAETGIPHVYIHNKTLKKYATGNGNASKTGMINAALGFGAPDEVAKDDNMADAWWLWAAGRHYFGKPVNQQVMLSRDVLFGPHAKTKWPKLDAARAAPSRATR